MLNLADLQLGSEEKFEWAGKQYVLREPSGGAVVKYRSALIKASKIGPDGRPTVVSDTLPSLEPLLVSMCVFQIDANGKESPVTDAVVQSWPNRLMKRLFDAAKELSQMDAELTLEELKVQQQKLSKIIADKEAGTTDAKKLRTSLTDGSD